MMVMGMSIPPPEEAQSFVSKTLLDTVLVSQKPSHSPASGSRGHCLHLPVRAGPSQGAGGSSTEDFGTGPSARLRVQPDSAELVTLGFTALRV